MNEIRAAWKELWGRLLSPLTARFILALLALGFSAYGAYALINTTEGEEVSQAAIFAVGQLFALATMAFGYYFGSTARNDDRPTETKIVNDATESVPVHDELPIGPRPGDSE